MSIHIRVATKEDYSALLPIAHETQDKHSEALPHIFQNGTAGLPEDYFLKHLEGETKSVYVAEFESNIVGYVLLGLEQVSYIDILVPRNVAFISDIVVLKSHQGKSIGYQLFQACVAWAKSKDADSLDLMVWNFNKDAIAFYERQGLESLNRTMSLALK
ncbi:MAG: GNAT family N-acetyltransferase [Ktedonobacteraceae bacterium]